MQHLGFLGCKQGAHYGGCVWAMTQGVLLLLTAARSASSQASCVLLMMVCG